MIESLLGYGHGAGEGHDHKTVFVARHGFQNVGGLAQLPAGKGGLGHGPHQVVDGMNFAQIERLQRDQPVCDWIVQMALASRAVMIVMFHFAPPFAKHYFTRTLKALLQPHA